MATNANLPAGAFITSLGGKRCTAIPKRNGGGNGGGQQQTATSTTQAQASSAPPPPPPPPPAETTTTAAQETTTTAAQETTTTAAQETTTTAAQETTTAAQETSTTQPQETTTTAQTTTAQAEQPPPAAAPIRTTTAAPPPPPQETTTQETSTPTSTTSSTAVAVTSQAPPPPPPPAETPTPGTPTPETPAAPVPTSPTTSPLPPTSTEQAPPPSPTTQAPTPPQPAPQDPPGSTAPTAPPPESSTVRSVAAPVLVPVPSSLAESLVQTSQAEQPDTATQDPQTQTADSSVPAITGPPTSLVTSNLDSATGGAGLANGVAVTTDGTRVLTLDPAAASSGSLGKGAVNGGGNDGSSSGATSSQTNIAIVAGVLGGLAFVLLLGFIFWFVRRRMRRDRRSTLLTPLGPEQGFGNMEKRPYFISRDSIGPTPLSEKFRATVGVNFKKIRSRVTSIVARSSSPSPSVNLDRGNSQFLDGPIGGNGGSGSSGGSAKGGFLGFFGLGRGRPQARDSRDDPFVNTRGMKDTRKRTGSQPDFLTLLNMDDQQLAAQTRRKSVARNRRSTSAGSSDHFLGGLGLGLDSRDPFSDANEMTRSSAKVAPLGAAKANPFSDANAIQPPSQSRPPGPSTYVETMRRSRGQSMGGSRPPSSGATHTRNASLYRESLASVESFETRRNKFRSDPFDLDRPELLSASVTSSALGAFPGRDPRDSRGGGGGAPLPPGRAHVRNDSVGSSNYSSGLSDAGDYLGDPGPDVGPAVTRNAAAPPPRRKSQASVGKAL